MPAVNTKLYEIGIDLDDTLFDFIGGFRRFYAKMRGMGEKYFPDPTNWDFSKEWGMTDQDELHATMRIFANEGGFQRLAPMSNSLRYMNLLKEDGHTLKIVTSRSDAICSKRYETKRDIQRQTISSLDFYDVEYDELHFVKDKSSVRMDILFDDAPHQLDKVQTVGVHPVCITTSHNTKYQGVKVYDWAAFYQYVRRMATQDE